jgi:prepilin-type N-terminal cleavage/methylation domain-containing protein
MSKQHSHIRGFTLIELSIVLVIIGLIVGGVLVGQDLIRAAGVRATISQIEKYNTAVNTFRDKYGGLPGDLNASLANQFGFTPRGANPGEGNGNGIIQGYVTTRGYVQMGEPTLFWVDLSAAHLIDGTFTTAAATPINANITGSALDAWLPQAKVGNGNYVYVWWGGYEMQTSGNYSDSNNYFGLSAVTAIQGTSMSEVYSNAGITVQAAYSIDQKIDDGLPQAGRVMAVYPLNDGSSMVGTWAAGIGLSGAYAWDADGSRGPTTAATPWAATNCYDNNNVAGPQTYSLAQNASQVNCALSFRFQ